MARLQTARFATPVLAAAHVAPESVDLKTPPFHVPAKSVEGNFGLMTSAWTYGFVRPMLAAAQVPPELVDLKTPPPSVPA